MKLTFEQTERKDCGLDAVLKDNLESVMTEYEQVELGRMKALKLSPRTKP